MNQTKNIVTSTEAVRSFSDIMNRVYYQHQSFQIKKGKEIVANIIPPCSPKMMAKDLKQFFAHSNKLETDDADVFIKEINDIRLQAKPRDIQWE